MISTDTLPKPCNQRAGGVHEPRATVAGQDRRFIVT
jgi:hypothetical protein